MPEGMREFDDAKATRKNIYDNVFSAMKSRFPIEDDNYRLELSDLRYDGPQDFSLKQQKNALLRNRNLRTNLVGRWRLTDKRTGKVLDEREDSVMQVPYWTDRGTIINNGSEYTVISQSRLRPGVYARRKSNGEFETQFNIRPGTGRSFHLGVNPETGVMSLQTGQGSLPLYQVLKGLGADDRDIIRFWGADIAKANSEKQDAQAWNKLYARMAGYKANPQATEEEKQQFVRDAIAKYEVDPEVVERTMGLRNVSYVTPELLLRASQKLLNVMRGDEKPDNRDSPRFSKFYGVEDYFKERIEKNAGRLANTLLFKARRSGNLSGIRRNALNPWVDTIINGSGLAMPGEEANPLSTLEQMARISKFGLGGIGSPEAVTMEARDVQGDYLGFVDQNSGPESERAGTDVRASYRTFLGKDNKLYGEFIDNRTGKKAYVDIATASDRLVAFPGQDMSAPYVLAMKDGVPQMVKRDEVRYTVPSYAHMIVSNTNMNPMPTGVQSTRQFYGSKFWSQYLPQAHGEVPLVDSLMPDGKMTWSEYYGRKVGTLKSEADGIVVKADDDEVTIKDDLGKLHKVELVKNLPFNRLSSVSYFPAVEVGQRVKAGDMVAHSNYTDKKTGAINMGQNLKSAVLPYLGNSYEDAYTISEEAAKKLATDRLYSVDHEAKNGVVLDRNKYVSAFPSKFTKDQVSTLDDDGIVKPGTVLHRGDPIVVSIGPKLLTSSDKALGKLSKALRSSFTDRSETWEHDYPGTVVDAVRTSSGARVSITAQPPVRVGDKLSSSYGLKGVVGKVIPQDKMPRDAATNQPYDVLINPMGFLSRVAPNQLMEMSLAKVAKATGKQIRIPQLPPPEGWYKWTKAQMDAAGVKESADVFDPESGRTIKNVGDGYTYIHAFHHLAEKKASARGADGAFTQDEQPAKGGVEGAKRSSMLDLWGMLSHNVPEVIKDSQLIRGTRNDDYWRALQLGLPVPEPDVPFIYKKFLNTLRAGGVNVTEKGSITKIMPQTDKDVEALAKGHVITSSDMVDSDFEPMKGGLFDLGKTGGMAGDQWSMIRLPEPVPNPIMEEPVRRVLGLTVSQMEKVLSGQEKIDGKTGGQALKDALAKVDVDKRLRECKDNILSKRGAQRDDAVKQYRYLSAMKKQGLKPQDWMIQNVPVIPPIFRPVSKMGDVALVSDLNQLYKDVIENAKNYEDLRKDVDDSGLVDERLNIYESVKAAFGLGQPITPENAAKGVKGAIRQVIGNRPKCYDSKTEVLTRRGWVPFGDVTFDDTVAAVNQITLKLEWQRPLDVIHTDYNGLMVHTLSKKIDLLVTPNHMHFVQKRVHGRLGGRKDEKGRSVFLGWHKAEAASLLYDGARMHMLTAPSGYDGHGEPDFPGVKDKLAFAFICGMYVAEGWDTEYSVNICQTSANPDICVKIRDAFNRSGIKYSENTFKKPHGRLSTYWSIYSKDAATWFTTNFGHLAGGKMISEAVLEWRSEYLRQLLDGYLYGDGEKLHGRKDPDTNKTFYSKDRMTCEHSRAKTTSKQLVDDMAELCMKIGLGFRLCSVAESDNPKWNIQYRFRIDGWNKVVIEGPKYHKWERYSGKVHCVTVPNGLVVVRRNGVTAVSGNSGQYQSKVLSKPVGDVARGVITPDPNLDMDQCGIPEDMAWPMYKPYVMRQLVQHGYPATTAIKMIEDRTDTARSLLEKEMAKRPVILDRAPTWHKFNLMAFVPFLTTGSTIRVSPLITSGFNADFDGDQMNAHVPSSDKAVQQAMERMLPSRNLISLTDLESPRHLPSKEQIFGLFDLTKPMTRKPVKVYNTVSEAKRAYANGEIGPNDPIEILENRK